MVTSTRGTGHLRELLEYHAARFRPCSGSDLPLSRFSEVGVYVMLNLLFVRCLFFRLRSHGRVFIPPSSWHICSDLVQGLRL